MECATGEDLLTMAATSGAVFTLAGGYFLATLHGNQGDQIQAVKHGLGTLGIVLGPVLLAISVAGFMYLRSRTRRDGQHPATIPDGSAPKPGEGQPPTHRRNT